MLISVYLIRSSVIDGIHLLIRFSFASPKEKLQKKRGGRNMLPITLSGAPPHFDQASAQARF
jgi:hypothetical protein